MEWIFQLAPPMVLMLALNVVGLAIKKSPVPDWLIVWALPLLGGSVYPFVASVENNGTANHTIPLNILYGVIIGGGAVWGNQLLRQTTAAFSAKPPPVPEPIEHEESIHS